MSRTWIIRRTFLPKASWIKKEERREIGQREDKMGMYFLCVCRLSIMWCINVASCAGPASLPIRVSVENDLSNMSPESYSSSVVEGGVLLGALRRLQETQLGFK